MSYSSYKTSYRGSRGGSSYGSRGGYRGSRGEGSSWSSRGSGSHSRGGNSFSSSSRGGRYSGTWEKETSSRYESPRYSSGDYGASSERYSSRIPREDRTYSSSRYSRQVSPGYGGREHNLRGSPEPSRKRLRSETSYQESSLRRPHEESYSSANDYTSRSYRSYGTSDDKGGGSSGGYVEKQREYRERDRSHSDDYQFRKVMGAPTGALPSRRLSPRGSFRGGRSFRGSRSSIGYFRGGGQIRRTTFGSRIRRLLDSSYSIKKREYLRQLRQYKLKRLAERMRRAKQLGSRDEKRRSTKDLKMNGDDVGEDDNDEDEDEDEEVDEEEEIEVEEEVETSVEEEEEEEGEGEDGEVDDDKENDEDRSKKEEDEELEEGETNEESEANAKKKKPKKKVVRKKVKKIVKKTVKREKPSPKKRSKEKNEENDDSKEGVHVTIKQDSDSRAVNEEGRKNYLSGRPFIRLECRHCNIHCVTFKEYNLHLHTTKHIASMRRLSLKLRQQLARMRIDQRKEQRILDEKDSRGLRTLFCSICKLNHRQLKGVHMSSIKHKKMLEFLKPYCRVCRLTFRSPMGYENHLCDLDHIRRTARLEYLQAKRKAMDKEDSGRDVDMDNFMILDSVGSAEESEGSDKEHDDTKEKTANGEVGNDGKKEKKKKRSSEIKLGMEYCKKVEVMYCDLCKIYLPRNHPSDKVVPQHCRSRVHLERLVRANKYKYKTHRGHSISKEEKEIKIKQEVDTDKEKESNKSAGSELDNSTSSARKKKEKEMSSEADEGDIDEKLWSEVDKDLGDLLREVEPDGKTSDEDEDREQQVRYDRFKLSEKDSLKNKVDDDEDDDKPLESKKSESSIKSGKTDQEEEEDEEEDDDEGKEEKSEA